MFQFPGLAPILGNRSSIYWVAPFRNLRIKGHLHLPEAYRSLSRLSSPLRAKASSVRPYLLFNQLNFYYPVIADSNSLLFCLSFQYVKELVSVQLQSLKVVKLKVV